MDWGEAIAVVGGVRQTVQVFVMRLNYSRRSFVMTFPSQNQESFLWAHVQAFAHFGGVPARISYDNLATAVQILTQGRVRREQRADHAPFGRTTCSRATSARRSSRMRRAASNTRWGSVGAIFWCPFPRPSPLRP